MNIVRLVILFTLFGISYLIYKGFSVGQKESYHSTLRSLLTMLIEFMCLLALILLSCMRAIGNDLGPM